jgi:hypothetical protein
MDPAKLDFPLSDFQTFLVRSQLKSLTMPKTTAIYWFNLLPTLFLLFANNFSTHLLGQFVIDGIEKRLAKERVWSNLVLRFANMKCVNWWAVDKWRFEGLNLWGALTASINIFGERNPRVLKSKFNLLLNHLWVFHLLLVIHNFFSCQWTPKNGVIESSLKYSTILKTKKKKKWRKKWLDFIRFGCQIFLYFWQKTQSVPQNKQKKTNRKKSTDLSFHPRIFGGG